MGETTKRLSEDLRYWRAERPDEWIMDRFIRAAEALESQAPTQGAPDLEAMQEEIRVLREQNDLLTKGTLVAFAPEEYEEYKEYKQMYDTPKDNRATAPQGTPDLEKLAALAHKQWSGWMAYLFSKCVLPVEPGTGTVVIPKWAVDRWKRQMNTSYADLPEEEKESDREEARKVLALVAAPQGEEALRAFCRKLVEWYDARNIMMGDKFAAILDEARAALGGDR